MTVSNSIDPVPSNSIDHAFIRGLVVQAIIGIHPHERVMPQPVRFDILAATDARLTKGNDHIDSGITNYSRMREIAISAAAEQFQLVESLAECIAQRILQELRVAFVEVSVAKPEAFNDAELVGVCIRRTADDAVPRA